MSDMKWYWHIHHDTLVEQSSNIGDRKEYIRGNKPDHEIPIRLKLLTEVRDQHTVDEAMMEFMIAENVAWDNYHYRSKIDHPQYDKIYMSTYEERDRKLEKLHKIEHPECPWDGRTIFPKEVSP